MRSMQTVASVAFSIVGKKRKTTEHLILSALFKVILSADTMNTCVFHQSNSKTNEK